MAQANHFLNIGLIGRVDPTAGAKNASLEAQYVFHRFGAIAQFENRSSYIVGARAHFSRHFFEQTGIRRNEILVPELVEGRPVFVRSTLHPWLLQTGVGTEWDIGNERLTFVISPSIRLKTPQITYTAAFTADYTYQKKWITRLILVRVHSPVNPWSVGLGFERRFNFGSSK